MDATQGQIVQTILKKHLSSDTEVLVFGSRATMTAKPYSDLDLALRNSKNGIKSELIAKLEYDFEESTLPWKVDIINFDDVNDNFKKIIERDKKQFIFFKGSDE